MAVNLTSTTFRSTLANGQPNALGKVYTYAAGTLTPQATYTTQAGDVANTNPVTLGADGCAQVWLDPSLSYRVIEKTAALTTIRDVDNLSLGGVSAADLASTTTAKGAALVGFSESVTYPASTAGLALQTFGVRVKNAPFNAVGNGSTDDTAAINAAIAFVKAKTNGGTVYFPPGVYAVTEINATSSAADFTRTVRLVGAGRLVTKIVPYAAGGVLLNMMGSNNMQVEGMTFSSVALFSQCAVYLARSTTSQNCNNNRFRDVFTEGSYSKASVVCNGSESSNWFNCRFENSNSSGNYTTFWTGGGTGLAAIQSVTAVNGGTLLDSGNPNTDNRMFGCEFYAPYANARVVRFSRAVGYQMIGCTVIAGSVNGARLVSYTDPTGGRFNGPVAWFGMHPEVFGTGNTVHYLDDGGAQVTFEGISSYSGYYVLSDNTAVIDYDRTNVASQPILSSSTWTTPTTSPNSAGTAMYLHVALGCDLTLNPNGTDGAIYLSGYAQSSKIKANLVSSGLTRFVNGNYESFVAALPTTGTYSVGQVLTRETPVVGQPVGWKCTVSGTLGTLNGGATTGAISSGSNVLTLSSATGAAVGQRISVAGSGAGPYYIRKLSGTTAYLDAAAATTVSGAAVAFSAATLVALANL